MPDIAMCQATTCDRSLTCQRHAGSGTIPHPYRQTYAGFTVEGCTFYIGPEDAPGPPGIHTADALMDIFGMKRVK